MHGMHLVYRKELEAHFLPTLKSTHGIIIRMPCYMPNRGKTICQLNLGAFIN